MSSHHKARSGTAKAAREEGQAAWVAVGYVLSRLLLTPPSCSAHTLWLKTWLSRWILAFPFGFQAAYKKGYSWRQKKRENFSYFKSQKKKENRLLICYKLHNQETGHQSHKSSKAERLWMSNHGFSAIWNVERRFVMHRSTAEFWMSKTEGDLGNLLARLSVWELHSWPGTAGSHAADLHYVRTQVQYIWNMCQM